MKTLLTIMTLLAATDAIGQTMEVVEQTLHNPYNTPRPCFPLPNARQLAWHETEFYAFFHYGMNTFTDKEWGYGDEPESHYAPALVPDCEQWVRAAKEAGMKGGIAVAKHHDGFGLWPTETTTHSVKHGGNLAPQVNIPKQFAEASEKHDMRYGFYISPWDRNSALYGREAYVKEVFFKQVEEVAREAGNNQFEMWFDNTNGGDGSYGGANEKRDIDNAIYYDRPNLYHHVHTLQPQCTVWGDDGEARWIGNGKGEGLETQWSTHNAWSGDEGNETGWKWYPNESGAKATDKGWFWHWGEEPLQAERIFQMYLETVGRNSNLILNLPPNRDGLLPEATVNTCREIGRLLRERLGHNLAEGKSINATDTRWDGTNTDATAPVSALPANGIYGADKMLDSDKNSYWATNDGVRSARIEIDLGETMTCHYVMLMEYIRLGQRVKAFKVEYSADGVSWNDSGATCTTIGYKRIIPLGNNTSDHAANARTARYIRVTIDDARACPLIHTIAVY